MLSGDEITRYTRQLGIENWGNETQEKLKNSTVFVAGSGGLGGPLLYYLTAAGIGTLKICDYDDVDLSNLNRQILHSTSRIGEKKVDSAFKTLNDLNPGVRLELIKEKITEKNADSLIGNAGIIVDCLDNFHGRFILNGSSIRKGIPLVHGGVESFQGQMAFFHPPWTPCLGCVIEDRERISVPSVCGATAGVIGSLQALETIKFLTGIGENIRNRLLIWDGSIMEFESIRLTRNPACQYCKNTERNE